MVPVTSAGGVVALLNEDDNDIKAFALEKLYDMVDTFWAEISNSIGVIEELYENTGFKERKLAALVASKVFYHLGELDDSLSYALGAAEKFDIDAKNKFVSTIIAKCIETYTTKREAQWKGTSTEAVDARLEAIVNRMFDHCFISKDYKHAAGIAVESHRLDILKKAIVEADNVPDMLQYCMRIAMQLVPSRLYRNEILGLLASLFSSLSEPDFFNMCRCHVFTDEPVPVADVLSQLMEQGDLCCQISFELYDNATQQFLDKVRETLTERSEGDDAKLPKEKTQLVCDILSGKPSLSLFVEFLCRNNHTDKLILQTTRDADSRSSIFHSATIMSSSVMYAGTTSDEFLRENKDWLKRANNWAKFNTVASLGVIHKGHVSASMDVLEPYLPKDGRSGSPYEKGGALYALGLIHANHGASVIDFLMQQVRAAANDGVDVTTEVQQHGGCLGLGLAAMGSGNKQAYETLKEVLYTDSAVAGEAAGLGMGMVHLGNADEEALNDMYSYACDTDHEKIIRGLSMGMAMLMYGRQEQADPWIEKLVENKDAVLRMGACLTIATAYAGTNDNRIIRRLLHIAVTDVSDDVRRNAVTALGFLLFRTPEQMPNVVQLLCESFNPHVRYGSCMALGIACAGTGMLTAISLIEPMLQDSVPYVRQAAMIATSLICMQQPNSHKKATEHRAKLAEVIADKHEDILSKFGAIYAQGILEAGGRNVTVQLASADGHTHMPTVVGMLVFTQFWYWFPLGHFLSLALTPTAVICLNADLKMPKLEILSNAKPSAFAYPPNMEPPKEKSKEKVETAILSTTSKAKAKQRKEGASVAGAMDVDEKAAEESDKKETEESDKKEEEGGEEKKEEATPEPIFQMLENPARVVKAQLSKVSLPDTCRYSLVRKGGMHAGINIVHDKTPDVAQELIEITVVGGAADEGEEAPMPEPFVFNADLEGED